MARYLISFTFLVNGEISYFLYSSPNERNIVFPLLVSQEARYLYRQLFFRPQVVHCREHSLIYKDSSFIRTLVCTHSVSCFCNTNQNRTQLTNMKYHYNPSSSRRVVPCGQTKNEHKDMTRLVFATVLRT